MPKRKRSNRKRRKLGCIGKVPYATQDEAKGAAGWAMATSAFKTRIYRCTFCGKFHFGHIRQLNERFFERLKGDNDE